MRKVLIIVALAALCLTFVWGQARTGDLYGKVLTPNGEPFPGVTVKLTGSLIAPLETLTDDNGEFRFLSLPPGTDYQVIVQAEGFKTFKQTNIRILVGQTTSVTAKLEVGIQSETVEVTGQEQVVDTKKTTEATNFTQEKLQELPTARDPWVLLELTPGVMVDRENVGGSESGQQSNFFGRGGSGNNAQWVVDGVTITDAAATGSSPMYYDYDSFEEIQITTAANDITSPTGGININFVTKRGGNKIHGGFRFYGTSDRFQYRNIPHHLADLGYKGNQINHIWDYGFNAGGPIVKDHIFVWGSYGKQDISMMAITGAHDDTDLKNYNFKVDVQYGVHRGEFFFTDGDKTKSGRGASVYRPPETTWDQGGPTKVYKFQDEFTHGDNWFFSAKFAYTDGGFHLIPKGGMEVPVVWDYGTGIWHNSYYYYDTSRDQFEFTFMGDYALGETSWGDHEIKFGAEFRDTPDRETFGWSGDSVIFIYPDAWYNAGYGRGELWLVRRENDIPYTRRFSLYVQDSITFSHLTLNLGIRYDRQYGGNYESDTPAPTHLGDYGAPQQVYDWLPAQHQPEKGSDFTWNTYSPRFSAIYDINGDGKYLIKSSFAIYGSTLGTVIPEMENVNLSKELDFLWVDDPNNNLFPDPGEIYWDEPIWYDNDYQHPNNTNTIDPELESPLTYEFTLGTEDEIFPGTAIGVNFIYRKMTRFTWDEWPGITADSYVPIQVSAEDSEVGIPYTYWQLQDGLSKPFNVYETQHPDYYRDYKGVDIIFKHRFSNHWMANASMTFQDWRVHYQSRAAYYHGDPTNHDPVDMLDNCQMAVESRGSGKTDVFPNSKWMFKAGGLYEFPWQINVGFTYLVRQGYLIPWYFDTSARRPGGLGRARIYPYPFDSHRLPNFNELNLKFEKKITIPINDENKVNVYLSADVFNVFNNNVALGKERNMARSTFGETLEILNPRVIRFGIRAEF